MEIDSLLKALDSGADFGLDRAFEVQEQGVASHFGGTLQASLIPKLEAFAAAAHPDSDQYHHALYLLEYSREVEERAASESLRKTDARELALKMLRLRRSLQRRLGFEHQEVKKKTRVQLEEARASNAAIRAEESAAEDRKLVDEWAKAQKLSPRDRVSRVALKLGITYSAANKRLKRRKLK